MMLNAIEGVVENERIRLREDVSLPENATVYVIIADQQPSIGTHREARVRSPRLANPQQAPDFRKQVMELLALEYSPL